MEKKIGIIAPTYEAEYSPEDFAAGMLLILELKREVGSSHKLARVLNSPITDIHTGKQRLELLIKTDDNKPIKAQIEYIQIKKAWLINQNT